MANAFCEKSEEYWTIGSEFVRLGCLNTAAHCLYYAVFQAVYGYAEANGLDHVTNDQDGSVHKAAMSEIRRVYGNRPNLARAARQLKAARIKADYKVEGVSACDLSPECLGAADTVRNYFLNR